MGLLVFSLNKRRFRGPGGVVRGLDFVTGPKSVRGNWPLWPPGIPPWHPGGLPWPPVASTSLLVSPVVSRGLPWSPVLVA